MIRYNTITQGKDATKRTYIQECVKKNMAPICPNSFAKVQKASSASCPRCPHSIPQIMGKIMMRSQSRLHHQAIFLRKTLHIHLQHNNTDSKHMIYHHALIHGQAQQVQRPGICKNICITDITDFQPMIRYNTITQGKDATKRTYIRRSVSRKPWPQYAPKALSERRRLRWFHFLAAGIRFLRSWVKKR